MLQKRVRQFLKIEGPKEPIKEEARSIGYFEVIFHHFVGFLASSRWLFSYINTKIDILLRVFTVISETTTPFPPGRGRPQLMLVAGVVVMLAVGVGEEVGGERGGSAG